MADLLQVSDATFDTIVMGASLPVLVDFYADWCGPCKVLLPALVDIATEYGGEAIVVKLNIDENPAVRDRFGIRSIPALVLFDAGEERERLLGAQPRSRIAAAIERTLGARA